MRILVDLLFYTGKKGGMESYVRNVYSRLAALAPDLEFVALASSELAEVGAPWFPGRIIDSGVAGENRVSWAWNEVTLVSRAAARAEADVIHSPANLGPWAGGIPVVVTTHDMLPFERPDLVPGRYAPVLRTLMRRTARHADAIITVSDASRRQIERFVPGSADRITVVPLAGHRPPPAAALPRDRSSLLAVGNRLPHKNFESLIRAVASLQPDERPQLTITGSHSDDPLEPLVRQLDLAAFVTLRRWIDDDELDHLYRTVGAVAVTSLFEGFGLPVVDALAYGCPVICSDIDVLHEVAGNAALYFDPLDPGSIARAIRRVMTDDVERERLVAAGTERVERLSWEATALATGQVLRGSAR